MKKVEKQTTYILKISCFQQKVKKINTILNLNF